MSRSVQVGLCTDSTAQLPPSLVERFGVEIVPVTITIDGVEHLDGLDVDTDRLLQHHDSTTCANGTVPDGAIAAGATVSQPSPGQYALAFERLLDAGATEIVSFHGPGVPGARTCSAARLAAHRLGVPVRLVDTGATGFALGCCVWAVAEALADGASIDEALALADGWAPAVDTFEFDALAGPSGPFPVLRRHAVDGETAASAADGDGPTPGMPGMPPLPAARQADVVVSVGSVLEAVNAVATAVLGWGGALDVGVGHASVDTEAVADALAAALGETAAVREVVRYRIGAAALLAGRPGTVSCSVFRPWSATAPSTPTAS